MSLKARIAGAVAGNASRKRNRCEAASHQQQSLIPFSMVQRFLQEQAVVRESGLDARAIHSVLVSMHAHLVSPARPQPEGARPEGGAASSSSASASEDAESRAAEMWADAAETWAADEEVPIDRTRCAHCGIGRNTLDEREGMFYCDHCGVVERGSINVRPDFQVAPEVSARQRGRSRLLMGVAEWVVARNRADGEPRGVQSYRDFMEDLEHWNVHVGHGCDVLRGLGRALADWNDPGHSRLTRAVTALLWPLMLEQLPNAAEIRDRMRRGATLPEIRDRVAEQELAFACEECGVTMGSRRAARFHCPRGSREAR